MGYRYAIHPAVGVARVGNSPDGFYLAPEATGGLPLACDPDGNETGGPVRTFKDGLGRIQRQAARFRVFRYDEAAPGAPEEVTLDTPGVSGMQWTVHLANKKAAWYDFVPLLGDVMLSPENTYAKQGVPLRNAGATDRRTLLIDPGPRTVDGRGRRAGFTREEAGDYPFVRFPPTPQQGHAIRTLGELRTDAAGRLLVLGAFGHAGGDTSISGFGGADTWHDDIADGPANCRLRLADGTVVDLQAWVVVGSPKFAPELVNLVTLDDIALDVAVRFQNLVPEMCRRAPGTAEYAPGTFRSDYVVDFERDIAPIIRRPLDYVWVANVPSMVAFAAPEFDPRDGSEANRPRREAYARYFRRPGWGPDSQRNDLFLQDAGGGGLFPLMPLNSGSNSVRTNPWIDKFLTLTDTQYFMLQQWAAGRFRVGPPRELPQVHALDRAALGNCVGSPMCPGIEVTWSTRNPNIYGAPYRILQAHDEGYYRSHGLDPARDETSGGGCEPGDLTKRMAIPWQADFFNCTAQFVNFTDPAVNKDENLVPVPPTYYAYWWPPQSPMYVVADPRTPGEQAAAGVMAGYQVYYQRGINTYAEIISGWSYLGFIVNSNTAPDGRAYPYFTESERSAEAFGVVDVAVGGPGNLISPQDQNFTPFWFLQPHRVRARALAAADPGADAGRPVLPAPRGDHR